MQETTGILNEVAAQVGHLDQAIEEVFSLMMGISCVPTDNVNIPRNQVTAVVGFAGALNGAYVINVPDESAMRIAHALMGSPVSEVDDMVKDSMGEVCNMLAGSWKGRFAELSSACMLSVPTILTGKDCHIRLQQSEICIERNYLFESYPLGITIMCSA